MEAPVSPSAAASGRDVGRRILRVESNLLGLPFFALSTRGLAQRDYLQVTGTKHLPDGDRREFSLTVSRSATRYYPGPLARKIHYALLDLLQDRAAGAGEVLASPAVFTWRNLHERMETSYHGATSIRRAKNAIFDTLGATIYSDLALMRRGEEGRETMPSRETGFHLYERCAFINEPLPEGGISDRNAVWLGEWYLANLNQLMTAPVDYDRWLKMNHQSPLASRLYELLIVKFNRKIPQLVINYPYFVSLLPAVAYAGRADAQRQLAEPFRVARECDVIADVQWTQSVDGQHQLRLTPGPAVTARATRSPDAVGDEFDEVNVFEGRADESPEAELVRKYHTLRFGRAGRKPTAAELAYARELLVTYKPQLVTRLLPRVADQVRKHFPAGQLFGAARSFFDQAVAAEQRATQRRAAEEELARAADEDQQQAERAKAARLADDAKRLAAWRTLGRIEQESFFDAAIASADSDFMRDRLRSNRDLANPPREVLQQLQVCDNAQHDHGL